MTKFNYGRTNKSTTAFLNDPYWTNPQKGFDKSWHTQRDNLKQNLGIHKEHDWEIINEPTGPHAGKVVCNTCKSKKGKSMFVIWIPKGYILSNT
jgi:hypothetical protein